MCGVYMEFTNKASKELKVYIEGNPVAVGELRDLSFDMEPEKPSVLGEIPHIRSVGSSAQFELSMDVAHINRLALYSLLYGRKITNNYLKLHGGIMVRYGGKRKRWRKN